MQTPTNLFTCPLWKNRYPSIPFACNIATSSSKSSDTAARYQNKAPRVRLVLALISALVALLIIALLQASQQLVHGIGLLHFRFGSVGCAGCQEVIQLANCGTVRICTGRQAVGRTGKRQEHVRGQGPAQGEAASTVVRPVANQNVFHIQASSTATLPILLHHRANWLGPSKSLQNFFRCTLRQGILLKGMCSHA